MAIRKRVRPPIKAAPANRVKKITSLEQYEALIEKSGNKLVVVQFYQSAVWTCKQMRPYFIKFSTSPQFRKILFAEVDVDEVEEVAKAAGIARIPTYDCYYGGELVDKYTGGVPNQLQQLIKESFEKHGGGSGGPLAFAIKTLAAVGLVAAAGYFAHKQLNPSASSKDEDAKAKEDLIDLKRRIGAARNKLRALENAHRGKQARAQRKIVDQLEAKRRILERGARSSSARNDGDGSNQGTRSSRRHQIDDNDEDEYWPLPPPGPKARRRALPSVLYTDEEEDQVDSDRPSRDNNNTRDKRASRRRRSTSPSSRSQGAREEADVLKTETTSEQTTDQVVKSGNEEDQQREERRRRRREAGGDEERRRRRSRSKEGARERPDSASRKERRSRAASTEVPAAA